MTDKDSHPIEYYLEFATASRNLCRIISLDESYDKRELIAHIVTTLQNFPDYLYEDDNFIEILDALVQDGIHQEPSLAEYWGNFLLKLGFAHLERYASQGEPQHIKRAIFLSEMAMTIVSREEFPRLWALFQVLSGDAKRFLQSRPEVSIPLMSEDSARDILEVFTLDALQHYHQALEVIRQDEDPSAWVEIANRLGYAYTEEITGDRNTNLRRAADLFIRIQETWESMGSVKGVAEARIDFADTLVSLNSDDQDIKLALDAYHHALNMLLGIGDKRAEEIIGKINALETVNFTTYYPRTGMPGRKFCFAVYAHLPELLNTVNQDAQKFSQEFGGEVPAPRRSRSNVKLESGTLVTIIPECDEIEFDPPELTKKWNGNYTRFLFDYELGRRLVNEVVSVRVSIQVAGIEIACINNCAIEIMEAQYEEDNNPLAHAKSNIQTSTLYQRIFVSYSRQDREITERYKSAQVALGNEVFIDVDNLRAGENWKAGLARAVDTADVFQLFWSKNSATSEYCRYEWNYALTHRCPNSKCEGFIRPVYWEKPLIDPPPELSEINFRYVPFLQETKSA